MKAVITPEMIQNALLPLIGLPLSLTRRNVDLRIFHFGAIRIVDNGSIGDYALHLSGKWALWEEDGVFVQDTDLYSPLTEDYDVEPEEWDYDTHGNWQDEFLKVVFPEYDAGTKAYFRTDKPLIVERIQVDKKGNVEIQFSHTYILVLSRGIKDHEDWRLFQPGRDAPHFVLMGVDSADN